MTQTTLFPLKAMGAEGEIKKETNRVRSVGALLDAPFLL
jgi:hypothetical protein